MLTEKMLAIESTMNVFDADLSVNILFIFLILEYKHRNGGRQKTWHLPSFYNWLHCKVERSVSINLVSPADLKFVDHLGVEAIRINTIRINERAFQPVFGRYGIDDRTVVGVAGAFEAIELVNDKFIWIKFYGRR
jgi:hypothetical protein